MTSKTNPVCRVCGTELNDENWYSSCQKGHQYICKSCNNKRNKQWSMENPDKRKTQWTHASRKRGYRSFDENRECSAFLGVHIAEQVLGQAFKNVQRMPMNNPGFDFICNRGKKIDVKGSCLIYRVMGGVKYSRWMFTIRHNTIADYFLCLAFDNRENLNPLYVWLLPGNKFNHLKNTGISPSTIHKWDKYRLDITKILTCCNAARSGRT